LRASKEAVFPQRGRVFRFRFSIPDEQRIQ
jgi:hypothetical protein